MLLRPCRAFRESGAPDQVWAASAAVLENIYRELNKRLGQLQDSLMSKLLGPGSPTGDVMLSYNKARVQFQADCQKVLSSFNRDFGEAKDTYDKARQSGKDAGMGQLQRVFDRYARKVANLQTAMEELVLKGNSVLDTEQLSLSLLKYWAEHDCVVRQVYNSLIDLDQSTRSCTMDMSSEVGKVRKFRDLLASKSQGFYNTHGEFDLDNGDRGLPEELLVVEEPKFHQPPQPQKVPVTMRSFAEKVLADVS